MTKDELRAQMAERFQSEQSEGYAFRSEAQGRLSHLAECIHSHGSLEQMLAACDSLKPIAQAVMEKL